MQGIKFFITIITIERKIAKLAAFLFEIHLLYSDL